MFRAKILADSLSPDDVRLTTFEVEFPRFILAEVNTHRMLSRNSASSRAIPLAKQIEKLRKDSFVPAEWPSEQKGMSGGDAVDGPLLAKLVWLDARDSAIREAERLSNAEVHKSYCNRLLEPFMWHTAIISGTEWDNFFALRIDENAQKEFCTIAEMMRDVYECHEPLSLQPGQWHLPLVDFAEIIKKTKLPTDCTGPLGIDWGFWCEVAVGRCARVSYETHDGKRETDKDVELALRLKSNGHLSPFEHVATPSAELGKCGFCGNFRGYRQYRKYIPNESDFSKVKELMV